MSSEGNAIVDLIDIPIRHRGRLPRVAKANRLVQVAAFFFGNSQHVVRLVARHNVSDAPPEIEQFDVRHEPMDVSRVQRRHGFKLVDNRRNLFLKSQKRRGGGHAMIVRPSGRPDLVRHDCPIGAGKTIRIGGCLQLAAARLAVGDGNSKLDNIADRRLDDISGLRQFDIHSREGNRCPAKRQPLGTPNRTQNVTGASRPIPKLPINDQARGNVADPADGYRRGGLRLPLRQNSHRTTRG